MLANRTPELSVDLPASIIAEYTAMRVLPDSRIVGVLRLLYHWTMHVDIDNFGYAERYCYETEKLALDAMERWDGAGDPINWHRHPKSGRRRNIITGEEWIAP